MTEARWHTAQVYYYDEDKRNLLLDCIQPLLQKVHAITQRCFFLAHWLRGPHLRLYFYCQDAQFAECIKPLLEAEIGAYLQMYPSQARLLAEDVRHLYEHRARLEKISDALFPLFPNNSIQYMRYDAPLYQRSSPTDILSDELLRDFYIDTNSLVFATLEQTQSGTSLLTHGFDLMVTTAHIMGIHIVKTYTLYRSQVDVCISASAHPQALHASLEKQYNVQANTLRKHFRELLEALDFQENTFLFTQEWNQLQRIYWERLLAAIAQKEAIVPTEENDPLNFSNGFQKKFDYGQWYQCYEPLVKLLHMHLERLGIPTLKRFLICYLITKTTEEVFNLEGSLAV